MLGVIQDGLFRSQSTIFLFFQRPRPVLQPTSRRSRIGSQFERYTKMYGLRLGLKETLGPMTSELLRFKEMQLGSFKLLIRPNRVISLLWVTPATLFSDLYFPDSGSENGGQEHEGDHRKLGLGHVEAPEPHPAWKCQKNGST